MAQAPRPGASKRKAEQQESQRVLTITVTRPITTGDGRVVPSAHSLAAGALPIRERVNCRKATGLPLEAFTEGEDSMGMDSIVVIWWLARRMNGEATLTFDTAADEWPADLTAGEIDVEVSNPDEGSDDPEA